MMRALLLLPVIICACAACVLVEGEHITGSDLARALPDFAKLPADLTLGFTPSPGVKRVFSTGEIARLAKAHGVELAAAPACFEYKTEPVSPERLLKAIREALPGPGVSIEVIDYSRAPLPSGRIEFSRSGLRGRDEAPVVWRGSVIYLPNRSLPVWVRVRLSADRNTVVASEDLVARKPIREGTVRLETLRVHPFAPLALDSIEAAIGRLPLRTIAKGQPVHLGLLTEAPDVIRGDRVTVEVLSGSARLRFEATAESGGRAGDLIMIRSIDNVKRFRARIVRRGVVTVEASS